MKQQSKFIKKNQTMQMMPQSSIESAKESANVTKAKHMQFVNQNVERAMQETTREGFDFRDTRNQFISTAKASFFQKTTLSAINAN